MAEPAADPTPEPEKPAAKTYAYILLSPQLDGLSYQFLGEFPGRSPEQAVEAAAAAGGVISVTENEGGLALGVIAIPASKWYVVEGEGERRVDWKFTRGGGDTGNEAEPAGEPPAAPPAPPDLDPIDPETGLKRL